MSDNENITESEALDTLSKSEDATSYIEQRTEDEDIASVESEGEKEIRNLQEKLPELKQLKKQSRWARMKEHRERLEAENQELRAKYEPQERYEPQEAYSENDPETGTQPRDSNVDPAVTARVERSLEAAKHMYGDAFHNAYEAFVAHVSATGDQAAYQAVMNSDDIGASIVQWWNGQGNPEASPEALDAAREQGRQQQEFQQRLAAHDEEIRIQAEVSLREEAYARENPKYQETVETLDGLLEGFPPIAGDLMRRSPVGPEMLYWMAHDYWEPNSAGILDQALATAGDPVLQAQFVGAFEQAVLTSRSKGGLSVGHAQGRATKAPPPLRPISGGASPPRDLHALAKSDSAEDYIKARRSAR